MEMAHRHGIPPRLSDADFEELNTNPPPWLAQSRANRTGKRPVWTELLCDICGEHEAARPKKWWPAFTYLSCEEHGADELPALAEGFTRREVDGIGSHFIGIVDEGPDGKPAVDEFDADEPAADEAPDTESAADEAAPTSNTTDQV